MEKNDSWEFPKELKITEDELKFISGKVEKSFEGTIRRNDKITTMSINLLGFIITIAIAAFGYSIQQFKNTIIDWHIGVVAAFAAFYSFSMIIYIRQNITSKLYYSEGTDAQKLIDVLHYEEVKQTPTGRMLIWEIEKRQNAMIANEEINTLKWRRFDNTINCLAALPFILVAFYFILYF